MAGFGSLNAAELDPEAVTAQPEETWQDREAQAALEALKLNKPPARSWYDTINDVTHFPHRMFGQLTSPRPDDPAKMFPENYVYRTINNAADALGGAIHSGITAPHDAATGELPMTDAEGHTSPQAISRAFDLASLPTGSSVAGTAARTARSAGTDFRVLGRRIGGEAGPASGIRITPVSELAAPYHDLLESPPEPAYKSPDAQVPTTAATEASGDVGGGVAGASGGGDGLQQARLQAERRAAGRRALPGLPAKEQIVDGELFVPGPVGSVHDVAERYMADKNFGALPPEKYHPVDPEHSTAIAKAFDEMKHAPDDPAVRASYEALVKETLAQYQAIKDSGLKITPVSGADYPYLGNPRAVAKDIADNNHMAFFKTSDGFGTGEKPDPSHPMLRPSGEKIGDHELLNNDLFRIVHDYFGHVKNGYGFRAAGEDNAWRSHAAMYSDQARPAMTSETRGQNSWVNYGPHGERNRTASGADTIYADQKVGLLPEWTMRDRGSLGTTLTSDSGKPGAVIAAAGHAPPFTTAAEPALERIGRKVGTAEQWKNDLAKYGVTKEEMKYRGFDELKPGQPLSREQVATHLQSRPVEIKPIDRASPEWDNLTSDQQYKVADAWQRSRYPGNFDNPREYFDDVIKPNPEDFGHVIGGSPPKYPDYQLPGGENYRERLLTLPPKVDRTELQAARNQNAERISDLRAEMHGTSGSDAIRAEIRRLQNESDGYSQQIKEADASNYKSGHWEEPNVIVHRRSTDREMPVPFTPEEQAAVDARAAAQGRLRDLRRWQGSVGTEIRQAAKPLRDAHYEQIRADMKARKISGGEGLRQLEAPFEHPELKPLQDRLQALRAEEDALNKSLPPEPKPKTIKTLHDEEQQSDWHQTGAKEGYGPKPRIPFEDYWKQTQIGDLEHADPARIARQRALYEREGQNVVNQSNRVPDGPFKDSWHRLALHDQIREAAEKGFDRISWTGGKSSPTNPKNLGRTGEEAEKAERGLIKHYDEKLVNAANKIGKAHGVQVEKSDVAGYRNVNNYDSEPGQYFPTRAAAERWAAENPAAAKHWKQEPIDAYHMDIPQSLKDQALQKGFSLFENSSRAGAALAASEHAKPYHDLLDAPHPGAKYPQYAEEYPPIGPPQLMDKKTMKPMTATGKKAQKLVTDKQAYWGKLNTPEATAFQKERAAIQKDMDANGYTPYFDPAKREHVDPANYPTPLDMTKDALPAKAETIAKYRKMFNTPGARARLQRAFDVGKGIKGANNWYAMRQLENEYVRHLGPEEGRARFATEFAHTMAATTGGADPTSNLLLAQYVQWAQKNRGGIPQASYDHPFPIGGRYVSGNIDQFRKMPEEGFGVNNPKRHDFAHAFLGHVNKATIDEQMSGGLVPGMAMPPGDSYGVAAQVVHDLAAKNGVHPRDFQDVAWAGLKKIKTEEAGKKFEYKGPMIQDVNDSIERTHRLDGLSRNEIVRRGLVLKEIPLYSDTSFGSLLSSQHKDDR